MSKKSNTTYGSYTRWVDRTDQESDPDSNYTWGAFVWQEARKDLLKGQRKRQQKSKKKGSH